MIPISLIKIAILCSGLSPAKNCMRDFSKEKHTGKKHCVYSEKISFNDVKTSSRTLNCSINDLIMFSLSNALATYFKRQGDEKTKNVSIMVPANIRWSMYKTFEAVKLENKFAPIPMTIPLETEPDKTIPKIKKVTKKMKSDFAVTYCMYLFARITGKLLPHAVNNFIQNEGSKSYTIGFSNSPGFLKEMKFGDVPCKRMFGQVIPGGCLGVLLLVQSYNDHFTVTLTADSGIMTRE